MDLRQQGQTLAKDLQQERDHFAIENSRFQGAEEQSRLAEDSLSSLRYHLEVANHTIKDLVEKNEALRVEVSEFRAQTTFLEEKNKGLRLEVEEFKAQATLLQDARRSSQVMGQRMTAMTTPDSALDSGRVTPMEEFHAVPAGIPTSVRDSFGDMHRVDLQADRRSSKIHADLTNHVGRRSLIGDIQAIDQLRAASSQTSEISVDLQSARRGSQASSMINDINPDFAHRSHEGPIIARASVGSKLQIDLTGE